MSNLNKAIAGIVAICTMMACSNKPEEIVRPANVPIDAVPAVGPDGGAWAKCSFVDSRRAECQVYYSATGRIWARGSYILKVGDEFLEVKSAEHLEELMSGFSLFNGQTIRLSDGNQLVPDGVIDSPFRNGGGKTTEYSQGVVTRAEEQYE